MEEVITAVRAWVDSFVVGMRLCPFAERELIANRVRFEASLATTEQDLLVDLQVELERLEQDESIETTLLIHAEVLQDFYEYNQFLDLADALLDDLELTGVYQIASFHPHYQFAGTEPSDAENYTNRAPYPILHILREASLERAIASYPDIDKVPQENMARMERLGEIRLSALLQACYR